MKKQIWALASALIMCLCLCTPAFGAGADSVNALVVKDGLEYDYVKQLDGGYYQVEKNDKYGLLDSNGNEIVPPIYDRMGEISGGMLRVEQSTDGTWLGPRQYGFVNVSTGELTIPIQYDSSPEYNEPTTQLSDFSNGFAVLSHTEYSSHVIFDEFFGELTVSDTIVKCGLMDKSGNMVIPLTEYRFATSTKWWEDGAGSMAYFFDDNRVVARYGEKWVVMDTSGKVLFEPKYDDVSGYVNGFAIISQNGKYGFIDTSGNVVVPPKYDSVKEFCNGYAIVCTYTSQGSRYGAVNQQGKLVVPVIYEEMDNFYEGMAWVGTKLPNSFDWKYGYVNTSGKLVVPMIYDAVGLGGSGRFHNGLAHVVLVDERFKEIDSRQCKHGYIDKQGNVVIPIIYSDAGDFSNGIALVGMGTDGTGMNPLLDNFITQDAILAKFKELGIDQKYLYINTAGKTLYSSPPPYVAYGQERFYVDGSKGAYAIMRNPLYRETATPTRSTVLVNGQNVVFDAYNINGNNYFKLRDLAKVLSGTGKQFEVTWDGSNKAINMLSGQPYTAVGGELASGDGTSKTAKLSTSTIYLDGQPVQLLAYNINGNNYFKLRDVGQALNFGVTWNGANRTIIIDTTQGYTAD